MIDDVKQKQPNAAWGPLQYASILLLGVACGVALMVVLKGPPQEIEAIQYHFQIVRSGVRIDDLSQAMRKHELGQTTLDEFQILPAPSLLTTHRVPASLHYRFTEKEMRSFGRSSLSIIAIPTVRERRVFTTIKLHHRRVQNFSLALRENETRAIQLSHSAQAYWYLLVSHRTDVKLPSPMPKPAVSVQPVRSF